MTFASNVAPRRIPLRPMPRVWRCRCYHGDTAERVVNKGYIANCPVCRMRRPS